MRKFFLWATLLLVFAGIFVGCKPSGAKKMVLRFGHLANESHSWHLAALKFKELVEQGTKGKIEVQVYPSEQLGNEMTILNGIKSGVVDMTITAESMQNFDVPLTTLLGLPYLIQDSAHLQRVMSGEPGRLIGAQILAKLDFYPLAYFERGPRNLTSNRPISTPADLQGIILRVPSVPLSVKFWATAGAKPTPMAFSEVFTALQQGTVEAQENPLSLIYSANFFEVQKYINQTEHVIGWVYVVLGNAKLQSMPEAWQKVVINAGQAMQDYEHQLFLKNEGELKQALIDKGMQFNSADKAAFAQIAQQAIFPALTAEQQQVYQLIDGLR